MRANAIYFFGGVAVCALISYPLAERFESLPMMGRCSAALAFLMAALVVTFARGRSTSLCGRMVFCNALLMLFASSLTFSIVRKEFVVVAWPSLFIVPGALFGFALSQMSPSAEIDNKPEDNKPENFPARWVEKAQ